MKGESVYISLMSSKGWNPVQAVDKPVAVWLATKKGKEGRMSVSQVTMAAPPRFKAVNQGVRVFTFIEQADGTLVMEEIQ